VLRGSLSQMNVIDLMQSLEMGRKSCLLTLTKDDEKCDVYFSEGQVVHAVYGTLKGDAAVFKVLRWMGGNFQLNFEGKTTETSTRLNTQGLLMEGLRLLDESNRDAGESAEEEDVSSTPELTAAVSRSAIRLPAGNAPIWEAPPWLRPSRRKFQSGSPGNRGG